MQKAEVSQQRVHTTRSYLPADVGEAVVVYSQPSLRHGHSHPNPSFADFAYLCSFTG
jgi:hypothetical protein